MRSTLILAAVATSGVMTSGPGGDEAGLMTYERVLNAHRFCQRLCQLTPGCRNDPHAHGSYCKLWQDIPVCFGLYHLPHHGPRVLGAGEAGDAIADAVVIGEELSIVEGGEGERGHHHRVRYCFEPFSRRCDDSKLKPVRCGFFPVHKN
jgi:hypothetical protein